MHLSRTNPIDLVLNSTARGRPEPFFLLMVSVAAIVVVWPLTFGSSKSNPLSMTLTLSMRCMKILLPLVYDNHSGGSFLVAVAG